MAEPASATGVVGTASATSPGPDRCPRCAGDFQCGMLDTAPCPCTTITLSPAALAQLRERFDGCLCLRCLAELAQADDRHSPPGGVRR